MVDNIYFVPLYHLKEVEGGWQLKKGILSSYKSSINHIKNKL